MEKGKMKTMKFKILPYKLPKPYFLSEKDMLSTVQSPAGELDILYVEKREEFEKLIAMLKYRGNTEFVPKSMGAMTVWGLFHIEKQQKLPLIILSSGAYSALSHENTPYGEEEWIEISKSIRAYHEMTHVVSRALFPENQNPLRDEILADYIGLLGATGQYDTRIAKAFLGIEGETYRAGGRLENYLREGEPAQEIMVSVVNDIDWLAGYCSAKPEDLFGLLMRLEEGRCLMKG